MKHFDNTIFWRCLFPAIFQACSTLGPAIGYLLGGVFLDIYTDFGKVDVDE